MYMFLLLLVCFSNCYDHFRLWLSLPFEKTVSLRWDKHCVQLFRRSKYRMDSFHKTTTSPFNIVPKGRFSMTIWLWDQNTQENKKIKKSLLVLIGLHKMCKLSVQAPFSFFKLQTDTNKRWYEWRVKTHLGQLLHKVVVEEPRLTCIWNSCCPQRSHNFHVAVILGLHSTKHPSNGPCPFHRLCCRLLSLCSLKDACTKVVLNYLIKKESVN